MSGLVETEAKITGISHDSLSITAVIRPPTRNYLTVDESYVSNVIGETNLTVTLIQKSMFLQDLTVFERMIYPLILGIDWIAKENIK